MSTDTEMRDRSMGDLTKQLSQDVAELVRREVELAKAEVAGKARSAVKKERTGCNYAGNSLTSAVVPFIMAL